MSDGREEWKRVMGGRREGGRGGGREEGKGEYIYTMEKALAFVSVVQSWYTVESGWNLWVWLVGVVSRRWVWLVGGIYGYGYNV